MSEPIPPLISAYRHELKIWPEYFNAILDGRKRFEIRDGVDRQFSIGDQLWLREYEPEPVDSPAGYTKRSALVIVTYIIRGPAWGLPPNIVVMSIRVLGDHA